jgi:hypothetical protein
LGEERKQTELTQHRIELGPDLSQEALGVLVCDFQGTDSNPLSLAQQSLDLACFAFGSPFIGKLGAEPVSDEAEPHMIADPVRTVVKDRADLHITLGMDRELHPMQGSELHVLKARLPGGILSKAQRGELKIPLPVGLVYDPAQRVVLDPDQQLQSTLRHFFETFGRTGGAWATVQAFAKEGLKFPRHRQAGSGDLIWQTLHHNKALILCSIRVTPEHFVSEETVPGKIHRDDGTGQFAS